MMDLLAPWKRFNDWAESIFPRWLWHPLTWACHGLIQYVAFRTDPGIGWGLVPMWYFRDRFQDHSGKPVERWPLDGIMDVGVPIIVQLVSCWVNGTWL